ncbi:Mor transcription activator family protein [Glaesserella parasuis]|uniref:Mor transcription activator family protein n=1 Tax=Glaesserella parasuis TaxID=738 RepID=UPI00243680F4|nr:Mor transcription activator family protein [Glaesserella parasuis]MDG6831990.1 Mor transcription activator family protein [Glaesserella parasuis]
MAEKVNFEDIRAFLPKTALDLVELIGLDCAILFIEAFGGSSFVISHQTGLKLADYMQIADIIGKENAVKVRQYAKNKIERKADYFYIPKCDFLLNTCRKEQTEKAVKPFKYSPEMLPFLPVFGLELLELLGNEAFEKFINAFGGRNFAFPSTCDQRFKTYRLLLAVLGREKADILTRRFNGEYVYIPSCAIAVKKLEQKKIVADYEALIVGNHQSFVFAQLARKYKCSDRCIQNIVNNLTL